MAAISSHCFLPEDLIPGILVRLPVKSLLRFMSTCKQWHTIITSPRFVNEYYHRDSNRMRLLFCNYGFGTKMDRVPYDETIEVQVLNPKVSYGYIKTLSGPCNGIFCVTYREGNNLGLWNPATRRFKLLPAPPSIPSHSYRSCATGFGVDPMTGEFKIVLLHEKYFESSPKVTIYTSSVNSWRYLDNVPPHHNFYVEGSNLGGTFSNGCCYWPISYRRNRNDYHRSILAFDMHKQVFDEIEMPNLGLERSPTTIGLCESSLALINSIYRTDTVEVWLMKQDGSWTKLNVDISLELCEQGMLLDKILREDGKGSWILDPDAPRKENILSVASYSAYTHLYAYYKENLTLMWDKSVIQN